MIFDCYKLKLSVSKNWQLFSNFNTRQFWSQKQLKTNWAHFFEHKERPQCADIWQSLSLYSRPPCWFLFPQSGIGKHNKLSQNFSLSSYHNTKLQLSVTRILAHTLGWNSKSCMMWIQNTCNSMFFPIPCCTKRKPRRGQNHVHMCVPHRENPLLLTSMIRLCNCWKCIHNILLWLTSSQVLKGTGHDSIFQISLFPHLLIFLQFRNLSCVLNLSTKAVLQKPNN